MALLGKTKNQNGTINELDAEGSSDAAKKY